MSFIIRKSISRVAYGIDYVVTRRLPTQGEIFVQKGDHATQSQIIGECHMPGDEMSFKVAQVLGVRASHLDSFMKKKLGERVHQGEVVADRGIWRLRRRFLSPLDGTLIELNEDSGMLVIQKDVVKHSLEAGFDGEVVAVEPQLAVDVRVTANILQGIFGFVENGFAEVDILTGDEPLRERHIDGGSCDKLIVSNGRVTIGVLRRALSMGVRGIVAASISASDWEEYILSESEKDFGSPEQNGLSLVFTEGFGDLRMREEMWDFLLAIKGQTVLMELSEFEQRPRIVFPISSSVPKTQPKASLTKMHVKAKKGARVRLISGKRFGEVGTLTSARLQSGGRPNELPNLAKIRLDQGQEEYVPRWNFEVI